MLIIEGGQVKHLRRYVGFCHSFFCTPSWKGHIFCSLIRLKEEQRVVTIRSYENATSPDKSVRQISCCIGLVTMRGNRIAATEHECSKEGSIAQTILYSAHRQPLKYLRRLYMGILAVVLQKRRFCANKTKSIRHTVIRARPDCDGPGRVRDGRTAAPATRCGAAASVLSSGRTSGPGSR